MLRKCYSNLSETECTPVLTDQDPWPCNPELRDCDPLLPDHEFCAH